METVTLSNGTRITARTVRAARNGNGLVIEGERGWSLLVPNTGPFVRGRCEPHGLITYARFGGGCARCAAGAK